MKWSMLLLDSLLLKYTVSLDHTSHTDHLVSILVSTLRSLLSPVCIAEVKNHCPKGNL